MSTLAIVAANSRLLLPVCLYNYYMYILCMRINSHKISARMYVADMEN